MSFLRGLWATIRRWSPFGLLVLGKPRHFRELWRVLWENRGRWAYALRILGHGVCDGCSLGPRGLRDDVLPGLHLCSTRLRLLRLNTQGPARASKLHGSLDVLDNEQLHQLGRVPYPLIRRAGQEHFERASWEDALALVAGALSQADPDRVGFYLTGRGLGNETYYMAQKLARIAGTPHVDSSGRLCHAAAQVGLEQTLGQGAPTGSLSDLIGTELILIFGSNLANSQPVMTKYLREARARGARIVVINPFREPGLERYWIPSQLGSALFGSPLLHDYHAVCAGGDIAFMSGLLKALDEQGGFDEAFVREHTSGAEALREHLAGLDWAEIESEAGVERTALTELAAVYARARTAVLIFSLGLTQYAFGVDNVKMLVNLALARGMLGRKHCGILPMAGHSGMQGATECGADAERLPGALTINSVNCEQLERAYDHAIPRQAGLRAPQLLERASEQGLDLLYLVGGNLLEALPDRDHARRGLANVKLRVHQDIVLNSSSLVPAREAVLILPAQTRYEQRSGGTSTSTERLIRFSPEIPGPRIAEARAEWEILALIGQRLRPQRRDLFHFASSQEIRAEMARVIPAYAGIEELRREGDALQWGGPSLYSAGFPDMAGGKARFSVVEVPDVSVPAGQFLLGLRRGKQFNSLVLGRRDPFSGGLRHEILMGPDDMLMQGLTEGDAITLRSETGEMFARLRAGPCRSRHVQGFWPECNVLLPRRYDPVSGQPEYATLVEIERAG
jgi:molybdopterin-dependent oxidoreductase alpha subunit